VLPMQFQFVAVCGRTGSGKSRLLEALAAQGAHVLDLEALAAHKGSVLGNLPDRPQPTQKWFESQIWAALNAFASFDASRPIFVEAESKKIGVLQVPNALLARMWESPCIELVTDSALRVPLLREEYAHLMQDRALLSFKLDCLNPLHSNETITRWKALAETAQWDAFVADMLTNHYDPAYERSMFRNYQQMPQATKITLTAIDADGFAAAARSALDVARTATTRATTRATTTATKNALPPCATPNAHGQPQDSAQPALSTDDASNRA
jgi:tRNA 2-selenouridine synthase